MLLEQGLVDEVLLFVYPVLLGRGKRFFSDSADPRESWSAANRSAQSKVGRRRLGQELLGPCSACGCGWISLRFE